MDSYKIVAFMESCKEDTVNIKNNDVRHLVLLGTNRNNYLIFDTDIHPVEKWFTVQAFDFAIPSVCVEM